MNISPQSGHGRPGSHAPGMYPHFQQTEDSRPCSDTDEEGGFLDFNLSWKRVVQKQLLKGPVHTLGTELSWPTGTENT